MNKGFDSFAGAFGDPRGNATSWEHQTAGFEGLEALLDRLELLPLLVSIIVAGEVEEGEKEGLEKRHLNWSNWQKEGKEKRNWSTR